MLSRHVVIHIVFVSLEELPTLRQHQEMTTLSRSFQHEISKEEKLMTSQQLRGHKVLLKNKKFVKRNRLKTQENTQKRVKNKLSSHLMENINEGPI